MFEKLKSLFAGKEAETAEPAHDPVAFAAAALMMEAARQDGSVDEPERARIVELLRGRFDLSDAECERLSVSAEAAREEAVELYSTARDLKDAMDHDERVAMIEMLWEVVYADGEVHDYEANLLRRVAGLLYVTDQESGAARRRVVERGRA